MAKEGTAQIRTAMVSGEAPAIEATADEAPLGSGIIISAQQQGQHFSPHVAGGISCARTESPSVSATAMVVYKI